MNWKRWKWRGSNGTNGGRKQLVKRNWGLKTYRCPARSVWRGAEILPKQSLWRRIMELVRWRRSRLRWQRPLVQGSETMPRHTDQKLQTTFKSRSTWRSIFLNFIQSRTLPLINQIQTHTSSASETNRRSQNLELLLRLHHLHLQPNQRLQNSRCRQITQKARSGKYTWRKMISSSSRSRTLRPRRFVSSCIWIYRYWNRRMILMICKYKRSNAKHLVNWIGVWDYLKMSLKSWSKKWRQGSRLKSLGRPGSAMSKLGGQSSWRCRRRWWLSWMGPRKCSKVLSSPWMIKLGSWRASRSATYAETNKSDRPTWAKPTLAAASKISRSCWKQSPIPWTRHRNPASLTVLSIMESKEFRLRDLQRKDKEMPHPKVKEKFLWSHRSHVSSCQEENQNQRIKRTKSNWSKNKLWVWQIRSSVWSRRPWRMKFRPTNRWRWRNWGPKMLRRDRHQALGDDSVYKNQRAKSLLWTKVPHVAPCCRNTLLSKVRSSTSK